LKQSIVSSTLIAKIHLQPTTNFLEGKGMSSQVSLLWRVLISSRMA